jgi:hypothetical protein
MIWALVVVPIAAGLGILLLPRRAETAARAIGVLVAIATFVGAATG